MPQALTSLAPTLRIGVTGHRLARLGEASLPAIAEIARQVLSGIAEEAARIDGARCVLVTNLADGADSLLADAALELGMQLDAVLPFPRAEYAADFAPGTVAEALERHLASASKVFELPGLRGDDGASALAYERAGRVVVSQCDLLVGIWDGQPALGRGGAAQILAEAVERAVPVILIDPAGKAEPQLLWDGLDEIELGEQTIDTVPRGSQERIAQLLPFLLQAQSDGPDANLRAEFDSDRPVTRSRLAFAYPLLLNLFGGRNSPPQGSSLHPSTLPAEDSARLDRAFTRADAIAGESARLFRSGYVANFGLAALAVFLSMLGLALPPALKPVLVVLEVVTIFSILLLTRTGNRNNWHRRWLDNRHLAERLRCLRIALQLGDLDLRGDRARHAGWASWYARAAARDVGLPSCAIDGAYLNTVRTSILSLLDEQIGYLEFDGHRMHRVEHRLHRVGTWLFGATALACVGLLAIKLGEGVLHSAALEAAAHPLITAGTIASAVLPAIGAAIYGIRMQGDFAGNAERNAALVRHLSGLRKVVAEDPAEFDLLLRRSRRITELLTENQASWLQTFHARPLALPG